MAVLIMGLLLSFPIQAIDVFLNSSDGIDPRKIDVAVPNRYILLLRETPLSELYRSVRSKSVAKSDIAAKRRRLSDVRAIVKAKLKALGPSIVHEEFETLISGISIEVESDFLPEIQNWKEVIDIFPVTEVSIPERELSDSSVWTREPPPAEMLPSLNVVGIWNEDQLRGEGIRVAVIDTGIDYTHPDLGGCLGALCKVKGGYNVVAKTADPRDDHGHGTHVAGIAAGDGKKKGVAPKASLYGYKVLTRQGFGLTDWVIKGLEMAVDPNGDGVFSDAAHVINFSLGSAAMGTQKDPLALAVDKASQWSVVVSAAGNSGSLMNIGSPGSALGSITVAATDESGGMLAAFSSWGPGGHLTLKPDIAAPGVDIWSSVLNGNYAKWSGTSMATPFVAGLSALLLQKYGGTNYTSLHRVRGALQSTAAPIPMAPSQSPLGSYVRQGHGVVQPVKAVRDSFGLFHNRYWEIHGGEQYTADVGALELGQSVGLNRVVAIPLDFVGSQKRKMVVQLTHDLGPHAAIEYWPKEFETDPSVGRRVLYVSIRASLQDIALNPEYPNPRGIVVAISEESTAKTYRVLLSAFQRARYRIKFDSLSPRLQPFLFEKQGSVQLLFPRPNGTETSAETLIPPGSYNEFIAGGAYKDKQYINYYSLPTAFSVQSPVTHEVKIASFNRNATFMAKNTQGGDAPERPILFMAKTNRLGIGFGASSQSHSRIAEYSDDWTWLAETLGAENDRFAFAMQRVALPSATNHVKIPENGYRHAGTIVPNIPGQGWPKFICHTVGFRPPGWWGTFVLSAPFPTQSNSLYVGGDAADHMGWNIKLQTELPTYNPCVGEGLTLPIAVQNGRLALADFFNTPFLGLPEAFEVADTVTNLSGVRQTVTNSSTKLSLGQMSQNLGETLDGVPINWKLVSQSSGEVIAKGDGSTSPLLTVSLAPGLYELTREHSDVSELKSSLTFSVPGSSALVTKNLPQLSGVTWIQEANAWRVYIRSFENFDGTPQIDSMKLDVNWRQSTEAVALTAVPNTHGIWSGISTMSPRGAQGELIITQKSGDYLKQNLRW